VNLDKGDPAEQLRALTGGHGPDVVLECVGHEAPFTQAIQSVRPGGTVSSVGVYVETSMGFPAREAFFKDLTLKMGICNARNYMTPLMPLVQRKKLQPARIVTHTMPLKDAPRGDFRIRPARVIELDGKPEFRRKRRRFVGSAIGQIGNLDLAGLEGDPHGSCRKENVGGNERTDEQQELARAIHAGSKGHRVKSVLHLAVSLEYGAEEQLEPMAVRFCPQMAPIVDQFFGDGRVCSVGAYRPPNSTSRQSAAQTTFSTIGIQTAARGTARRLASQTR